jgi:hypothetical protein
MVMAGAMSGLEVGQGRQDWPGKSPDCFIVG